MSSGFFYVIQRYRNSIDLRILLDFGGKCATDLLLGCENVDSV